MEVQVVYYSRGGNTQKLAQAIAKGAGVTAQTVSEARLTQPVDTLFVGGAVYAGGLDSHVVQFLQQLSAGQVGQVVTFSTSMTGISIVPLVRQLLEKHGISVSGYEYHCKGKFLLFNRKRPNDYDLRRAADFAAKIVSGAE